MIWKVETHLFKHKHICLKKKKVISSGGISFETPQLLIFNPSFY